MRSINSNSIFSSATAALGLAVLLLFSAVGLVDAKPMAAPQFSAAQETQFERVCNYCWNRAEVVAPYDAAYIAQELSRASNPTSKAIREYVLVGIVSRAYNAHNFAREAFWQCLEITKKLSLSVANLFFLAVQNNMYGLNGPISKEIRPVI